MKQSFNFSSMKIKLLLLLLFASSFSFSQCITSISAADFSTAIIRSDGSMYTAGRNDYGQQGDGTNFQNLPLVFKPMNSDADWSKIIRSGHSLAIKTNGTLWTWGYNNYGQIGNGNTVNQLSPYQVGTDTDWVEVGNGVASSYAIKANGTLWSWGRNDVAQLGNGTYTNNMSILQMGTDADWAKIISFSDACIALKTNGTLWSWGYNSAGQLGLGTIGYNGQQTLGVPSPQQIGSATNWVKIATGGGFSMAIKNDGTLWAWGANGNGRLGIPSVPQAVPQTTPLQVGTDANWLDIDLGSHSLAVKTNGTLWAWGYNYFGQLGDGTTVDKNVPTQVGTATNWVAIAADSFDSLALNSEGMMYGFGNNQESQLGIPQYISPQLNTPTLISVSCSNLGVNPVKEELVSTAYPNPTTNYVTIAFNNINFNDKISYGITNILGQKILLNKNIFPQTNSFTVDLSSYPNGIYLVDVSDGINVSTIKVIKQ